MFSCLWGKKASYNISNSSNSGGDASLRPPTRIKPTPIPATLPRPNTTPAAESSTTSTPEAITTNVSVDENTIAPSTKIKETKTELTGLSENKSDLSVLSNGLNPGAPQALRPTSSVTSSPEISQPNDKFNDHSVESEAHVQPAKTPSPKPYKIQDNSLGDSVTVPSLKPDKTNQLAEPSVEPSPKPNSTNNDRTGLSIKTPLLKLDKTDTFLAPSAEPSPKPNRVNNDGTGHSVEAASTKPDKTDQLYEPLAEPPPKPNHTNFTVGHSAKTTSPKLDKTDQASELPLEPSSKPSHTTNDMIGHHSLESSTISLESSQIKDEHPEHLVNGFSDVNSEEPMQNLPVEDEAVSITTIEDTFSEDIYEEAPKQSSHTSRKQIKELTGEEVEAIISSKQNGNKVTNVAEVTLKKEEVEPPTKKPVEKQPKKKPFKESSKNENHERRPGVIPLPVKYDENSTEPIPKHAKDPADATLIRAALERNEFLNKILKGKLLDEVVDAMYNREINAKEIIIKEGERGSHMYVSAKGKYEVSMKGKGVITAFDDVRVFGELAILYNDRRLATIKAIKSGRVWVLNRSVYQQLMVRSNIKEQDEMLNFLQNVSKLNTVGMNVLQKVANLLKVEFYQPGATIVRQGDRGDKFYIIRAGTVTISRENEGVVGECKWGQYFGEHALLAEDCRQATVTANPPGVECLTLQRQHFIDHFGEVNDISTITIRSPVAKPAPRQPLSEYGDVELKELRIVKTLGVGGFGRVELVQHLQNSNLIFALKYLKKIDMVEQNQQEHVYNEKNIQMSCKSSFIIRLYRTYKDRKYIYFLMESCLGGDLWTLLQRQKNRRFEEKDARFIAACVLEAFGYLHERGIVYRDLKPENLLIDKQGYIKLTDFGFAKKLGPRGKTFTFAGTPEYVAPEIVLNKGHDKAVDYWAFGIFIFELLTGRTPFRTNDSSHMRTYTRILAGIDNVEFPPFVSHKARHVIEKLLRQLATERLGCLRNGIKDIKSNRWFMGFDWVKLNDRKLPAPFKPKLKSDIDTQYFESFKRDDDNPPDELSGWDQEF